MGSFARMPNENMEDIYGDNGLGDTLPKRTNSIVKTSQKKN